MDIYDYLKQMSSFIEEKNWDGLESNYKNIAKTLANKAIADEIADVDIQHYQNSLNEKLSVAVKKAKDLNAKAIYFEYDLDNDWQGNFFICQDYNLEIHNDDDWACDWVDEIKVGDFSSFGDLYVPGFDRTQEIKGVNLFLIARTVAAFGRCCEKFLNLNLALCIAFHDQDPIIRIFELDH